MTNTRIFTLLVVLLVSVSAFAQPGDPGGGGNPTVPISGIEILVGGGALLGLRRLLANKSSRKE